MFANTINKKTTTKLGTYYRYSITNSGMSKKPEQFSEEKKFNLTIIVIKKEFKNVVQYYKYWENNDIV